MSDDEKKPVKPDGVLAGTPADNRAAMAAACDIPERFLFGTAPSSVQGLWQAYPRDHVNVGVDPAQPGSDRSALVPMVLPEPNTIYRVKVEASADPLSKLTPPLTGVSFDVTLAAVRARLLASTEKAPGRPWWWAKCISTAQYAGDVVAVLVLAGTIGLIIAGLALAARHGAR